MNRDVLLTGTPVTAPAPRILSAGLLQAQFGADGLRWVRWNGVEVLRAVQFLLRTPGWGTLAPLISGLEVREDAMGFAVSYRAQYGVAGAGVVVEIGYAGAGGTLTAQADIRAEVPFDTNRAGFVILHPLAGFGGTEVVVDHASGPVRRLTIPMPISPGQPVFDIRAITHQPVAGLTVETRFAGDVFEMEDQRNWSDASFKTYSRPIGLPHPYRLMPDAPVTQSVTVTITDTGEQGAAVAVHAPKISGQCLPDYALPLDRLTDAAEALASPKALLALAPQWILLRLVRVGDLGPLARLMDLTKARLEVMVMLTAADDAAAEDEIASVAEGFRAAGLVVSRVSAFAKVDEQSFQPGQARPPHPAEPAIAASLARHFDGAERIGGTPAYFTEFNRKRPDPALWQGLRFATTPVVHAADDASVMETLEALPHIMGSASALAAGLGLSIGPVGIGARINPYGPEPSANDPQARVGMAARDPRQRGLFAAAWTVGYLARVVPFGVGQFAFGAAVGPFGLLSTRQDYPRDLWDDLAEAALYPLYHVARWIAAGAGGQVLLAETVDGSARIVWRKNGYRQALVANLTAAGLPVPVMAMTAARACVLDAASLVDLAVGRAPLCPMPVELDAYAVAFLDEREDRV